MSSSPKWRRRWSRPALLCLALMVLGCGLGEASVLDPKGPNTRVQRDLLFTALGLMLIVVIPVFVMTFGFAWRYRASNRRAAYAPDWSYSARIDAVVWLVPVLIVLSLGVLVWRYSHRLDPYRPIAADAGPLQVQAVVKSSTGCSRCTAAGSA